jgi:hypothetical protein
MVNAFVGFSFTLRNCLIQDAKKKWRNGVYLGLTANVEIISSGL